MCSQRWRAAQGTLRNESDEPGAKLMTGSLWWKNYTLTTDIEVLIQHGHPGVSLRSSDEECGVDSYTGYYVGRRSIVGSNNTALRASLFHCQWLRFEPVSPSSWLHFVGCANAPKKSWSRLEVMSSPVGAQVLEIVQVPSRLPPAWVQLCQNLSILRIR